MDKKVWTTDLINDLISNDLEANVDEQSAFREFNDVLVRNHKATFDYSQKEYDEVMFYRHNYDEFINKFFKITKEELNIMYPYMDRIVWNMIFTIGKKLHVKNNKIFDYREVLLVLLSRIARLPYHLQPCITKIVGNVIHLDTGSSFEFIGHDEYINNCEDIIKENFGKYFEIEKVDTEKAKYNFIDNDLIMKSFEFEKEHFELSKEFMEIINKSGIYISENKFPHPYLQSLLTFNVEKINFESPIKNKKYRIIIEPLNN